MLSKFFFTATLSLVSITLLSAQAFDQMHESSCCNKCKLRRYGR